MNTVPKLPDSKRKTRDLLGELHSIRSISKHPTSHTLDWNQPWPTEVVAEREARMAELRAELATREHVPGTLEGKTNRQKAASMNRGQGKSKNR